MSKSLRDQMPGVASVVDELRQAFGVESINAQIKKAIAGERTFYACENGHEIGTPLEGMSRGIDNTKGE